MPGLIGCLSVDRSESSRSRTAIPPKVLEDLRHETDYRIQSIDLVNGSMAMVSAATATAHSGVHTAGDGITVAFQGEIYSPDLPEILSPIERAAILGDLYRRFGDDLARRLNGSFVLFIDDAPAREQLLLNDVKASRHVYYTEQNGALYFAPELKCFARFGDVNLTLDLEAFLAYFANGHLFQSQTFFKEVRPLPPGTQLRLRNDRIELVQYFRFDPVGNCPDRGEEFYKRQLGELMLASVDRRLGSDRTSVIPLSGGWDSRAILGCALRLRPAASLQTVSWGVDENAPGSDPWVARSIAAIVGTRHRFIRRRTEQFTTDITEMVWRTDGLTDDPAAHHNELNVMKRVVSECGADSLLRGDQIFGEPHKAHNDVEALAMTPLRLPHEMPSLRRIVNPEVFGGSLAASSALGDAMRREPTSGDPTDRADYWYFHHRLVPYLNRSSYYKLTVLELQNPWLDRNILEFLQTLPTKYRAGLSLYLTTLRWMFPDLMRIPRNQDKGLENWRQVLASDAELQAFIRDHLSSEGSELRNWIDRRPLEELLTAAFSPPKERRYAGRAMESAKALARAVIPSWYGALKAGVRTHVRPLDVPIEYLLFRLLIAKLWLDMVRRPVAEAVTR